MKAVFVDRDGTLIVEPPNERLTWVHDITLFPDTIEALQLLQTHGFAIIMITNQAGIGEGLLSLEDFERLELGGVEADLAEGGVKIKKVFVCPHADFDHCDCRKPKPTMILEAAEEFDIDLKSTYMIGDRPSDMKAGRAAGCKTILVKTASEPVEYHGATYTAAHLLDAARYIISH